MKEAEEAYRQLRDESTNELKFRLEKCLNGFAMSMVKLIMRYMQATLEYKLCLDGTNIKLKGYCNGDWGEDANERRSTTKLCVLP
ncbi:hypothetical protein AXG93_2356s1050 [Marchantia polymorpha subsp. ruderalis]|uniref:Uncharacterized protein n=1 Tax=Marchantia polymorpha subsp. ruderalis TaxID=1480154 RepID=A0A176WDH2_MARPO|nr:hypothetical protein AXG93_2356s1050 [Marchantia polymorpha subsp. ruderalis]